jgi:hypothetical protein
MQETGSVRKLAPEILTVVSPELDPRSGMTVWTLASARNVYSRSADNACPFRVIVTGTTPSEWEGVKQFRAVELKIEAGESKTPK